MKSLFPSRHKAMRRKGKQKYQQACGNREKLQRRSNKLSRTEKKLKLKVVVEKTRNKPNSNPHENPKRSQEFVYSRTSKSRAKIQLLTVCLRSC